MGRGERYNKVRTFFAIRLKLALLRMYLELNVRVSSKACLEFCELLHMIGEAERNRACLVHWWLNRDNIVHFGFKSLKDRIELPTSTTTLIDYELYLCLKWSQGLESQVEQNRLIRRRDRLRTLVYKDTSIDDLLVSWVYHIDLEVESVICLHDIGPR